MRREKSIQNKKKIAQMILGKDNTTSKALSFKKLKTHDATSSSGQIPEKSYFSTKSNVYFSEIKFCF
jgi:hypothetical protein